MRAPRLNFPLVERATAAGVLDGGSALIVAPTATGKSHIGRESIARALERETGRTHSYLVPFRALAEEVFESFLDQLEGTDARIRVSTGDHREPIRPGEADLIVATYESFIGLVRQTGFRPGTVVADEVHLVADDTRGPAVEGLFARILASGRIDALCALSAVVENGQELADWLDIPLIEGTDKDRPVPLALESEMAVDLEGRLLAALEPCRHGSQALVFCNSRSGAEKAARQLAELTDSALSRAQRRTLEQLAEHIAAEDPAIEDVIELIPMGVAYHHAGLPKPVRRHIEDYFRDGLIQVIAATPTLAAGVNLPAEIVVVRDVFRSEVVRGAHRRVVLPSGEVLNMLGRAGRPHQAEAGRGIALVEQRFQKEPEVVQLVEAIQKGRGGVVGSRLPDSFEGLMRFVLAVVSERGEATKDDVAQAFQRTLAYHTSQEAIGFERSFEEDLMEDLPAYQRVAKAGGAVFVERYHLSPDGVHVQVASGDHGYEVTLGVLGVTCGCPAASKFYRAKICKHQACAIHDLLFAEDIEDEARARAIYTCGHIFTDRLDIGTRLIIALELLDRWDLIERVASGWRVTPIGDVAVPSGFDLLLVRQTGQRIAGVDEAGYRKVASWAVEDYFAEDTVRERWADAIDKWLDELDERSIKLPTRYRGDFERGLDDLARVCLLYGRSALALGKTEIADAARQAAGAVRYGVAPEVVPLMALQLPQLARARSRYLFDSGIRNIADLAAADPAEIADPRRAPEAFARRWVERAKEIHAARAVATADREEADQEFDELVARFRLDPAALV